VEYLVVTTISEVLKDSTHSLSLGREGETDHVSLGQVLHAGSHDVAAHTLKELNSSSVSGIYRLRGVASDSLLELLGVVFGEVHFPVEGEHFVGVVIDALRNCYVLASPNVSNLHLVPGQSSGLVRADVVSATHDFTGSQTLNIVVVLKHSLDRVGERDHDGQGETLGHSYHNDSHTDDQVLEPLGESSQENGNTLRGIIHHFFAFSVGDAVSFNTTALDVFGASKEIHISVDQTFEEVTEEEHVNREQSNIGSELTDIGGDFLKFVLKRSGFGARHELLDNLANGAHISDHYSDKFAFTALNVGSREEEGRGNLVLVKLFGVGARLELLLSLKVLILKTHVAVIDGVFAKFIGLSGHSGLVNSELRGGENQAVNWNVHTFLNDDDVTNMEVLVVDCEHRRVAQHIALLNKTQVSQTSKTNNFYL